MGLERASPLRDREGAGGARVGGKVAQEVLGLAEGPDAVLACTFRFTRKEERSSAAAKQRKKERREEKRRKEERVRTGSSVGGDLPGDGDPGLDEPDLLPVHAGIPVAVDKHHLPAAVGLKMLHGQESVLGPTGAERERQRVVHSHAEAGHRTTTAAYLKSLRGLAPQKDTVTVELRE